MSRRAILLSLLALTLSAAIVLGSSAGEAYACDANVQHAFGVEPSCADQQIVGAPTASDPAPDFNTAGGHPFAVTTRVNLNAPEEEDEIESNGQSYPPEPVKDLVVRMPPGFVADTTAVASCSMAQFKYLDPDNGAFEDLEIAPMCPSASQVGVLAIDIGWFGPMRSIDEIPLYYLGSPPGELGQVGFTVLNFPSLGTVELGPDDETVLNLEDVNAGIPLDGAAVTLWGDPADPRHTPERACPGRPFPIWGGPTCAAGTKEEAFVRLPTTCGEPPVTHFAVDSWTHPGVFDEGDIVHHAGPWIFGDPATPGGYPAEYPGLAAEAWGAPEGLQGCAESPFEPGLSVQPTSATAGAATGVEMTVSFPQKGLAEPEAISESDLRDLSLSFPVGMTINPAVAGGLTACTATAAAIGAKGPSQCPDSSKLGQLEIVSPLTSKKLTGAIYLASGQSKSQGNLDLPVYLVGEAEGINLKLTAHLQVDGQNGQLTATLREAPQVPMEKLSLKFFGGDRSAFVNPDACGSYRSQGTFVPWSGGSATQAQSSFQLTTGSGGKPCGQTGRGFAPKFSAGVLSPVAADSSPLVVRIRRGETEQELAGVSLQLPPGVSASLRGVAKCGDAALAAAKAASAASELAHADCPSAAWVGNLSATAGAGGEPLELATGKLYLAGRYEGAPLSLAAVVPVMAGPIDLGTLVARFALQISRTDGHVSLSGTLPTSLDGIPLRIQTLKLAIERQGFLVNPTNCAGLSIDGDLLGSENGLAHVSPRFQMVDCGELPFRPRISASFLGGPGSTLRAAHPSLVTVVSMRRHEARLHRAVIVLPASEQLDPAHVQGVCTQDEAENCKRKTEIGVAEARTPLLDKPLRGHVFLRSAPDQAFPLVSIRLAGEVRIDVTARLRFVGGRIEIVLPAVPDVPIGRLTVRLLGGRRGILINDTDLCAEGPRADARMVAQGGQEQGYGVAMRVQGCDAGARSGGGAGRTR